MKEKAKCAAAVVKKQLLSCCPYGRLLDREELEDLEQEGHLQDGDASVTSHLCHHAAVCVPKVADQVVATKSSAGQPIIHNKIMQGTMPISCNSISSSRPKVLQSAITGKKLCTFSPWSMVKPALKPAELQIFSPLYAQSSLRPAKPLELQIPSSCSPPTQAIRLESNALVDSATTLSIDFSPISDDSSRIHAQSESRWGGSPTRLQQQHTTSKHIYVPRGPLFHPSFEIVSNQGIESPGATSPLSYSSQHLKSKLTRHVSSGDELPSIRAASAAPPSSSSTQCGHGSKCSSSIAQKISKETTRVQQLHAPGLPPPLPPPPAAASPGKAGLGNVIHPSSNKSLKLAAESIAQTGPLTSGQLDTRQGSRGCRGLRIHEESHAIKLGTRKPFTTRTAVSSSSREAAGCPVQSPHSRGSATITASGPAVSNGSLPSNGQLLLLLHHHPESSVGIIRGDVPCSQSHNSVEDVKVQAAVKKMQVAFRGYRSGHTNNKRNASDGSLAELSCGDEVPVRLLSQELKKEGISIGTQMSRTEAQACVKTTQQQQQQPAVVTPAVAAAPKAWNASIHTAQDYKAILRRKQEAAMKRDRALQYGLSHQHWKKSSKLKRLPGWSTEEEDDGIFDKAGWIWNWLERAARLGVHGSQELAIFDNTFSPRDPESESLSVKSSVGICTTELGSCGRNNNQIYLQDQQTPVGWSNPDQWPLSLRQQHAAGLLQAAQCHDDSIPQEDTAAAEAGASVPSDLSKPEPAGPPGSSAILAAGTELILRPNPTSTSLHHQNRQPTHKKDMLQKPDLLEKGFSFTATDDDNEEEDHQSCVAPPPPQSDHGTSFRNGHGVMRKLKFGTESLQQENRQESVGSCVAGEQEPTPTTSMMTCRITSHVARGDGGGHRSLQSQ